MACFVAKETELGFYCPMLDETFARRKDVPFCGDWDQQAKCGNQANESILSQHDTKLPQNLVEGFLSGTKRGLGRHDRHE